MTSPLILQGVDIPEQLPGEPYVGPLPLPRFLWALSTRSLMYALLGLLTLPLWPPFLLGVAIWGWPPNAPTLQQVARYLGYTWGGPASRPLLHRLWLTSQILRKLFVTPLWGLAWQLDELLYGRELDGTPITAPLIKISAARSGSTQMARYLEEDPHLIAPTVLQIFFPYLWLWRIAPYTLGRLITREQANAQMHARLPPEFLERHEGDLFQTDTFEVGFFICQLNHLAGQLGPDVFRDELGLVDPPPWNRAHWQQTFVAFFDRIGRKTLLWHGSSGGAAPRRLFIKGHFLAAADALEQRYPDARFLTMIRHPSKRLESMVNYLRANRLDPVLNEVPWSTLGPGLAQSESRYCEVEQAWFTREGGARRCAVRFSDYVRDLEGAMGRVYRECLDLETLPHHVPREHEPRRRTNYQLNRTLEQVGVDRAAYEARLADYIRWCKSPSG